VAACDLNGDHQPLIKVIEVGEMLLAAFDTPNHMPIARWDFDKASAGVGKQIAPDWMPVSELGSLSVKSLGSVSLLVMIGGTMPSIESRHCLVNSNRRQNFQDSGPLTSTREISI
jgi:hypothetical protein